MYLRKTEVVNVPEHKLYQGFHRGVWTRAKPGGPESPLPAGRKGHLIRGSQLGTTKGEGRGDVHKNWA